jgi:hypothetical protein
VLAWYLALHNPDRFAGVLAGPGMWREGYGLAINAALFSSLGIVSHRGDRVHEAFLAEIAKLHSRHLRLEALGSPEENRRALGPVIAKWWQDCSRPPAPLRIRLAGDRATPVRAYWLRLVPRVPSLRQEQVGRSWTHRSLAQDAKLEAQIVARDLVAVEAERVAAFDLFLDPTVLEPEGVLRVRINGQVPEARVARGDIETLLDDYRERRDTGLLYLGKLTFTVR